MQIGVNDKGEEFVRFECPDMLLGGTIIQKEFKEGQFHIKVKFGEGQFGEASDESLAAAYYKVIALRHFPELFNTESEERLMS
jgi:hypothetical protein